MLCRMTTRHICFVVPVIFTIVAHGASGQEAKPVEQAYHKLADEIVASHFEFNPAAAVELGFHDFDGKVINLSRASLDRRHAQLKDFRSRLTALDARQLGARLDLQRRLLLSAIENELLNFEVKKSFTHNPMTYAAAIDTDIYAKRDFAPKPQRLRSVITALAQMPGVMKAARENLDAVLPKPLIATSIEIADGAAEFQEHELIEAFSDVSDAALQSQLQEAVKVSARQLRNYVDYLKTDKLPKANQSFAIGRVGFSRMLSGAELITKTPEQILEIGLAELHKEQQIFAKTAARIDSTKPPIEVFKAIQRDHPTADSLLPDVRHHLETIRSFLIE
jgi:uncharacterized protein (DUF885 family)